ncbi:MAG: hypothetical protein LBD11_04130 [Candidatus Peribacteria bacterium]|jgi:hypothetical protein|nr:hypothetical protein [Candidatus Peribacteria bacterium]
MGNLIKKWFILKFSWHPRSFGAFIRNERKLQKERQKLRKEDIHEDHCRQWEAFREEWQKKDEALVETYGDRNRGLGPFREASYKKRQAERELKNKLEKDYDQLPKEDEKYSEWEKGKWKAFFDGTLEKEHDPMESDYPSEVLEQRREAQKEVDHQRKLDAQQQRAIAHQQKREADAQRRQQKAEEQKQREQARIRQKQKEAEAKALEKEKNELFNKLFKNKEMKHWFKRWKKGDGETPEEKFYNFVPEKFESQPFGHTGQTTVRITKYPKIIFTKKMDKMIRKIVGLAPEEIGWFCGVRRDELHPEQFWVENIYILDQKTSPANCTLDSKDLARLMEELVAKGEEGEAELERIKFWGHCHVKFEVNPSSQDVQTFDKFGLPEEFYIRGIFNKLGAVRLDLMVKAFGLFFENVEFMVSDPEFDREIEKMARILEPKITPSIDRRPLFNRTPTDTNTVTSFGSEEEDENDHQEMGVGV